MLSSVKKWCSVPVGYSVFFIVWSWHVDHIISHFFTELKIYHLSSFYHTHDDFDIVDLSSTQDVYHTWTLYMAHSLRDLRSSLVRASDWCTEGHSFNSYRGLSLSRARDTLITPFLSTPVMQAITIVLWKSPTTTRKNGIPGVCQNPLGLSSIQFPNKRTWKSPYKKQTKTNIKTNKKQITSCMI